MKDWVWLLSAIAGLFIWLAQKRLEMKVKVFDEAVMALLRYQTEATDQELQNQHSALTDSTRRGGPYLSNETSVLVVRSTALISDFFSQDVSQSFTQAMNSIHLGGPSTQMGGPVIKGHLSIPEIEKIIKGLSKELTFSHILKTCLFRVLIPLRLIKAFRKPVMSDRLKCMKERILQRVTKR